MKKVVSILLILALMAGSFLLGRFTAPETHSQTFYATITQKSGDHLIVEGIPENDINHRWQFQFTLEGNVPITWRGMELTMDDLDVGDLIAVTYTGSVLEISPAIIQNVLRIQLLEDER